MLSDRLGHHRVMQLGPLFGLVAVIITGLTTNLWLLGGTRLLEGASTAASVPSILGFIAMATANDEALRGKTSSRFEAATIAGLGAGFAAAGPLWTVSGRSRSSSTRHLRGVAADLPLRRARDAADEHGRPPHGRSHGRLGALRELLAVPRLAAGADLDRHQRGARAVHQPDAVPAGPRARPALPATSCWWAASTRSWSRPASSWPASSSSRGSSTGEPLQGPAADDDHLLRHRWRALLVARRCCSTTAAGWPIWPRCRWRSAWAPACSCSLVPRPPRSACWRTSPRPSPTTAAPSWASTVCSWPSARSSGPSSAAWRPSAGPSMASWWRRSC